MSREQLNLDEMYRNALHLDNPLQNNKNIILKSDVCLAVQRIESDKYAAAIKYYEYLCKKQLEKERIIGLTNKSDDIRKAY